jgi:predicted dehydrogenase
MSTPDLLRIGFIGAGSIARGRHLPGLAKLPNVRVVAVSNRTRASADKIARDHGIPDIVENWRDLLGRPDIDAVFIGTWPYMHREMSVAAMDAGKHVFCQARMAMDLAEARDMLAAAERHPGLIAQICPPPTRMPFEPFIKRVLERGDLGPITSVELRSFSGGNLRTDAVHWRERREFSGNQILAMGIYAETLNAWVGPYESLSAKLATPINTKRDESGTEVTIRVPQVVTIHGRLASGALCVEHHHGLAADKTTPGDTLTVWGLEGTLRYTFGGTLEMAAAGEALRPVQVPGDQQRDWHVEEDFIASVRAVKTGESQCVGINPDFAEGLAYMRKVEAVHRANESGREVRLAEL